VISDALAEVVQVHVTVERSSLGETVEETASYGVDVEDVALSGRLDIGNWLR